MEAAEILQRQLDAALRKIDDLEKDNQKQRDELREARDVTKTKDGEIETLRGKVPAEGALVLTGKKAEQYRAFEDLKLEPQEIKQRLESESEKDTRLKALERRDRATRAAGDKYLAEPILELLPADADLEETETTIEGKATKVWQVKQGDTAKPLSEWVEGVRAAKPYITFERESSGNPAVAQAGRREPPQTSTWAQAADSRFGVKSKTN